MAIMRVTEENFEQKIVQEGEPVLVMFPSVSKFRTEENKRANSWLRLAGERWGDKLKMGKFQRTAHDFDHATAAFWAARPRHKRYKKPFFMLFQPGHEPDALFVTELEYDEEGRMVPTKFSNGIRVNNLFGHLVFWVNERLGLE